MKAFDGSYILVKDMASDKYYPKFLVERVRELIVPVIQMLEQGETDLDIIQDKLDDMTRSINGLQGEFEENGSEIETGARESIAETIEYILEWFDIDIDVETALQEREW